MQTSSKKQISRAAIGEMKWTDEGSGKHGKAEDTRADQADSDSADQRKTDFAASVGKPGDKCIQGKGEGEKRGLGDYP